MRKLFWVILLAALIAPAHATLYVLNSTEATNRALVLNWNDTLFMPDLNFTVYSNATFLFNQSFSFNQTFNNTFVFNCTNETVFVNYTNQTNNFFYGNSTCEPVFNQTYLGIFEDRVLNPGEVISLVHPEVGLQARYECKSIVQQDVQRTLAPGEAVNFSGCGTYNIQASNACPVCELHMLSQPEYCSNYTPPGFISSSLCLNASNYNATQQVVYQQPSGNDDNTLTIGAALVALAVGYLIWKRAQNKPAQSMGGVQ